jgi:hypothetical protein
MWKHLLNRTRHPTSSVTYFLFFDFNEKWRMSQVRDALDDAFGTDAHFQLMLGTLLMGPKYLFRLTRRPSQTMSLS